MKPTQTIPTKHYRDAAGNYLGGFGNGAVPPDGAIEVPSAPNDATQVWNGTGWGTEPDYSLRRTEGELLAARIAALEGKVG